VAFGLRRGIGGDAMISLTAGALAANLLLVGGLVALVAANGLGHFWQADLVALEQSDGTTLLGEIADRELDRDERGQPRERLRMAVGNRDLGGSDFRWIDVAQVTGESWPSDAGVLEREEWGRFYGFPVAVRQGERVRAEGAEAVWAALPALLREKREERAESFESLDAEIRGLNAEIERLRREGRDTSELQARYEEADAARSTRETALLADVLVMRTADGREKAIPLAHVVRAVRANALGTGGKLSLYASRLWEFVAGEPRESNTEGGIFPAIFGTVLMVLLTSLAVAPFGVLTALYLREYASQGIIVRAVRIAVNSLAGVPSIVFGVFGLGFFVYLVGGTLDSLFFADRLPTPTFGTGGILWASLTLALLTVPVVVVATEEGLAAVPRVVREGSLALGATKFETLWRVVLPAALPGVLTGLILAMARAAGEVAPLMIVGMVKLAPSLPLDGEFPFLHLERKFMHLGFHIYDVGFQSPNIEAVRPLVFATALLLILVVLSTNLTAILVRNHLRRKYAGSAI
jgi:phosphate transport system permease protein